MINCIKIFENQYVTRSNFSKSKNCVSSEWKNPYKQKTHNLRARVTHLRLTVLKEQLLPFYPHNKKTKKNTRCLR